MADIAIENISEVIPTPILIERTPSSKGSLKLDEKVSEMYLAKGYDTLPKTAEEAKARGAKGHNGLMSSIFNYNIIPQDNQSLVMINIAPTRYNAGQALRDLWATGKYSLDEIKAMSPDMLNVSLQAPVKEEGEYFLPAQIKGKALGSGQVHTGLVAGNVDAKYLLQPNPLTAALKEECSEELGLDLSHLDSTSFIYMVDERETGQVNFASIARKTDLNKVLHAYEALTKAKLQKSEALEVMALTTLPIAGIALIPLESGKQGLKGIKCYKPTSSGLSISVEDREVRPYTEATIKYLQKPENVKFLLEKAGF
ncbi:hypothetical protein JXB28_00860 [Candidatus Woesearchaeota archaeon]|nr:hypothetical protein [Candidatus Woesearchaeota archaeon]